MFIPASPWSIVDLMHAVTYMTWFSSEYYPYPGCVLN
jgi:hypothetical protein